MADGLSADEGGRNCSARVRRISVQNLDHVIGQYLIDILSRSGIRKTKNLWGVSKKLLRFCRTGSNLTTGRHLTYHVTLNYHPKR